MPKGETMKIILALIVLGMCAFGGVSQEHAPTVDMCRADAALWYSRGIANAYNTAETAHVTDDVPNRTEIAKLPLPEINERTSELGKCFVVDKDNSDTYCVAQEFYHSVLTDRYLRFVWRHHLKDQLMLEDAQGIR
jgi:hypothetical protein